MQMRKRMAAAVLATVALFTTGATASHAFADDTQSDFNSTGVRIHQQPTLGSGVNGLGNPGDGLTVHSYTIGDWVQDCGNGIGQTYAWDYITDNRTGVSGYVVSCYVGAL
ncbi:hypothetical protein ACWDCB_08055 [Streptomyces sp. NPDC001178]|uniref:hypothetical protein n=1 Tax=Streptomyces sp. NPDC001351 TaxID=3364564 RepID=UPI00367C9F4A